MIGERMFAPYETLIPAYRRKWENLLAGSPIPQMPLLLCGGWDSRPWHGDHSLVRFGRTPELFKWHLQDAKQFLETPDPKIATPKMILVEAWNEWGEGSYIEPHQQFGFGYLDAIRDVFTDAPKAHAEMTPADVDLGPYDVAPLPAKTMWDFESGDDGWTATKRFPNMGATNGCLVAVATANAAAFYSPSVWVRAGDFRAVAVRLKLTGADGKPFTDMATCGWRTSFLPMRETSSVEFQVQADGEWHEYRIPVSQNRLWHGMITGLRLNPCRRPNVRMQLDSVRLAE